LLPHAPRWSQACHRRSQAWRWCVQVVPGAPKVPNPITITPMVLRYQSSEIPDTLKAGRNSLLGSDTLLKSTHLSLHSTSSQILVKAWCDYNTFPSIQLVLATVPGYPDSVRVGTDPKAPVQVRNSQVPRPAMSWRVCYPGQT
jgi:hypothetical protein